MMIPEGGPVGNHGGGKLGNSLIGYQTTREGIKLVNWFAEMPK